MRKTFLQIVIAIFCVVPLSAQTIHTIPEKDKGTYNPNRPKMPSREYVTMYVYSSENVLTFDFSDNIQSMFVTLTDTNSGEMQTGTVSHETPSLEVILPDYGSFSVTCEADNGSTFYTEFSY